MRVWSRASGGASSPARWRHLEGSGPTACHCGGPRRNHLGPRRTLGPRDSDDSGTSSPSPQTSPGRKSQRPRPSGKQGDYRVGWRDPNPGTEARWGLGHTAPTVHTILITHHYFLSYQKIKQKPNVTEAGPTFSSEPPQRVGTARKEDQHSTLEPSPVPTTQAHGLLPQ